jgi:hypothetical protein
MWPPGSAAALRSGSCRPRSASARTHTPTTLSRSGACSAPTATFARACRSRRGSSRGVPPSHRRPPRHHGRPLERFTLSRPASTSRHPWWRVVVKEPHPQDSASDVGAHVALDEGGQTAPVGASLPGGEGSSRSRRARPGGGRVFSSSAALIAGERRAGGLRCGAPSSRGRRAFRPASQGPRLVRAHPRARRSARRKRSAAERSGFTNCESRRNSCLPRSTRVPSCGRSPPPTPLIPSDP